LPLTSPVGVTDTTAMFEDDHVTPDTDSIVLPSASRIVSGIDRVSPCDSTTDGVVIVTEVMGFPRESVLLEQLVATRIAGIRRSFTGRSIVRS
jgi:hypothetical protein